MMQAASGKSSTHVLLSIYFYICRLAASCIFETVHIKALTANYDMNIFIRSLISQCLVLKFYNRNGVNFMLEYLKKEANRTYTENGAVTYASTGSECLDLFATIGAMRNASKTELIAKFMRAYIEDADTAMKLLFFARDIRGGLGERKIFRILLRWLGMYKPQSARKNIEYVAEYGRFDDILVLLDTPCEQDALQFLKEQFESDMEKLNTEEPVSLLGKWLPSINASNAQTIKTAKKIARAFGLRDAEYRKALTALRARIQILENHLRERDYSFSYEKQPSRAMFKYRKAFLRNDEQRYQKFLENVSLGKAQLHADNISPYELISPYIGYSWETDCFIHNMMPEEEQVLNTEWNALPNFCNDENALAVIDTSGSMYPKYLIGEHKAPMPGAVALSLGLYVAEHNTGAFHNHFIEFSETPQLIEIKGDTFADRLRYVASFCEVANTNLEAVFGLVLDTAVKNRLPQKELPSKLIIISDMEFDCCMEDASSSNFEHAKRKYALYGYHLPQVIFWNVNSKNRQQPVTQNEQGVALVSGVTPRLFSVVAGGNLSPYALMMDTLMSERYAVITA